MRDGRSASSTSPQTDLSHEGPYGRPSAPTPAEPSDAMRSGIPWVARAAVRSSNGPSRPTQSGSSSKPTHSSSDLMTWQAGRVSRTNSASGCSTKSTQQPETSARVAIEQTRAREQSSRSPEHSMARNVSSEESKACEPLGLPQPAINAFAVLLAERKDASRDSMSMTAQAVEKPRAANEAVASQTSVLQPMPGSQHMARKPSRSRCREMPETSLSLCT